MINIILSILYFSAVEAFVETKCPVTFCSGIYPSEGFVETFCKKNEGKMDERCCISNNTIIGLDFRSCDIERLNITSYTFTDVSMMDLRNNTLENITTDDLKGLTDLNVLYLPHGVSCPGGNNSWNDISLDENMTTCMSQINPCQSLNISCTENGECLHTGPGSAKCVCLPGHHGYKCLNEGEFPTTVFSISLFVCTTLLCAALWFAVGRDASKSMYNTL